MSIRNAAGITLCLGLLASVAAPAHADEYRWVIYFSADNATISEDERLVVAAAAQNHANFCAGRSITIVAKTDTVGSDDDNLRRSQVYGQAVKDELIADGVKADLIRIDARGETSPDVATGDNVAEDINRNAEIVMNADDNTDECGRQQAEWYREHYPQPWLSPAPKPTASTGPSQGD